MTAVGHMCGRIIVLSVFLYACSALAAADLRVGVDAYVRGDYAVALKEFQALADQGDAAGEYNIGVMHETGRGVERDYAAALEWYQKGVVKKYPPSFYSMGNLYLNGWGVEADKGKALDWFKQSADLGYAPAQFRLGFIYMNDGDLAEARRWYEKAAALRYSKAMYEIAAFEVREAKRSHSEDDTIDAYMWLTLALLHGLDRAEVNTVLRSREVLAGLLDPRQILEAIDRTRRWLADAPSPEAILAANALADKWMNPAALKTLRSSPELSFADYLSLKGVDFAFDFDSGAARGRYVAMLEPGPALPDRAYMKVTFENPREYFNPFIEHEVIEGKPQEVRIESPRSDGFICGPYVVIFSVYADEARSNLLGVLRIIVRSNANTSVIRSQADMIDKINHGQACQ